MLRQRRTEHTEGMCNKNVAMQLGIVMGVFVLPAAILAPDGYQLFVGLLLWNVLYMVVGVAIFLADRLRAIEETLKQGLCE